MNEMKLDELFRAFIDNDSSKSRYAIWEAADRTIYEVYHIEKAATAEAKKDYFMRLCKGIAHDFPSFDWSMLPVFELLDPVMICNEVLYYTATPQAEEYTVTYLQGLVARIAKRAAERKIPMPSDEVAAQTLVLLRYIRQPEKRFPFLAHLLRSLCSFLEYTPKTYSHDYLGVCQFQELFQAVNTTLLTRFPEEIRRIAVEQYKEKNNSKYFDRNARYLSVRFLMAVVTDNLCGVMSSVPEHRVQRLSDAAFMQHLENAKETVALLEPQLAFCKEELAFFCSCLSPGRQIMQRRFGEGSVLTNDGTTMTVQFCDGKKRKLKLIAELVNDQIIVDADRDEFEMRLYFARDALKHFETNSPMLTEAKARLAGLSAGTVSQDALLAMKLFQPNA